ncbi:MAG: PIN domain-containing protein [Nanoarchaeota archaeon]|nr:PIN domain-containing protein [Nanoarchaeota archaeon]
MVGYFFDSYAVIELLDGNPMYARYSQEPFAMTVFNLVEIYWFALREYGEKIADEIYEKFRYFVINANDKVLKKAVKFRIKNKKKNLSYADCIGYTYALENNLLFLTGDKEFEKFKNVEFVK